MSNLPGAKTQNAAAYTSLAVKYRPQTFEEVVGQDSVSKTLTNALKTGRLAHAYLFYGPRGCGKTTTARLLAKALNCTGYPEDKPTPKPCGKCPQCIEIAAGADMDVLELDAASNTQVEKVREAIIDTVSLAAGRDRYKVFILDEVHMLSASSFNALLKTIEEPPKHVVFILATTELHKVPLTISSRCQTFRFKPITEGEISAHLMDLAGAENVELEEEAAKLIAKNAGGALRDALTIFERSIAFSGGKVSKGLVSEMLGLLPQDLIKEAAFAVVNNDGAALHKVFNALREEGFDALSLLKDLKTAFGEIFYLSLGAGAEPFAGAKDILARTSAGFIAGLTRKIARLADEVKFSDTPALSAEVGLFTIMENTLDIEAFVRRLEELEQSIDNGAPPAADAPKPEKKSLIKPQAAAAPQPEAAPQAQEPNKTAAQIWDAFKKGLCDKYPFLCDIVQEANPAFEPNGKWTLKFNARDAFMKASLEKRVKDLQAVALAACGVTPVFNFELTGEAAPEPQPKPIILPKPAAVKKEDLISKEQPYAEGDFTAAAQPQAAVTEVGEKTQRILNFFEGQLVESA
jgi:DNA polymerase-3 subunit gamma/tau